MTSGQQAGRHASKLLPAHLMVGSDELKKKNALKALDRRLGQAGDPAFNRDEYGSTAGYPEPAELLSSLDTLPFGSEFRLVIIHDVETAGKALTEQIVSYLKNPNPTTVLAMTATRLASNTRLYKAVAALGANAIVDCSPKKRRELPVVVRQMAAGYGLDLDPDAAAELVSLLGESRMLIDSELAKLAVAFAGRPHVSAADVRENVARVAQASVWDFLDAVSRRDPVSAMRLLLLMPDESPMGVFSLTLTRVRQLLVTKCLERRGAVGSLAHELGLQPWQVRSYPQYARNYAMGELVGAIQGACECELALKSRPDKMLSLQRWILSFCHR